LPLKDGAKIICGNALQRCWDDVCPSESEAEIFVMGNPPYLGARQQTEAHKKDMELVAGHIPGMGNLDYISGFLLKAAEFIRKSGAIAALVSTNSIGQGEQVALLWPHIIRDGVEVGFVHQAFKWSNSAKDNAAVICVVIGLRPQSNKQRYLYSNGIRRTANRISPYFIEGDPVYIENRRTTLSQLPPINYGSFALDDGNYTLTAQERAIIHETGGGHFTRPFLGAKEFIQGHLRYCLWIGDNSLSAALANTEIAARVAKERDWRRNSDRRTTVELAETPHRFAEIRQPTEAYFVFPTVSSERRHYIPVGLLSPDTVASNQLYVIPNAEQNRWVFAAISSRMHMVWVQAVAGRLKTDFRYSSSICYNNFPFPPLTLQQKTMLGGASDEVFNAREQHFPKTIAWLYDPDTMPADLLAAHQALDLAVEKCYRDKPFTSDEERLEYLFALYQKMTAEEAK
jgi:hypothetical protein